MLNARKQEGSYLYVSQYIEKRFEEESYHEYNSAAFCNSGCNVCGKWVEQCSNHIKWNGLFFEKQGCWIIWYSPSLEMEESEIF